MKSKMLSQKLSTPLFLLFLFVTYLHFETALAYPAPPLSSGAVIRKSPTAKNKKSLRDTVSLFVPPIVPESLIRVRDEDANDDRKEDFENLLGRLEISDSKMKIHSRSIRSSKTCDDVTSRITTLVRNQLDLEESEIKPEATFVNDLGVDSLGIVELVLATEEEFDIEIPDEDVEKINTVGDLITYINNKC